MLRPYHQGDLTGLCGVYSVINAARLVAGLNKEESEQLFRRIMRYIVDARLVADGIGIRMIGRLLRDMVGERIAHRAMPFRNHRDASLEQVWFTLNDFFAADDRRAAIIYVEGPKGHWTTVHDATPRQLLLTDSVGYHVLSKGKCTMGSRSKEHPHALYPPCIYLLSQQPYTARVFEHPVEETAAPGPLTPAAWKDIMQAAQVSPGAL